MWVVSVVFVCGLVWWFLVHPFLLWIVDIDVWSFPPWHRLFWIVWIRSLYIAIVVLQKIWRNETSQVSVGVSHDDVVFGSHEKVINLPRFDPPFQPPILWRLKPSHQSTTSKSLQACCARRSWDNSTRDKPPEWVCSLGWYEASLTLATNSDLEGHLLLLNVAIRNLAWSRIRPLLEFQNCFLFARVQALYRDYIWHKVLHQCASMHYRRIASITNAFVSKQFCWWMILPKQAFCAS